MRYPWLFEVVKPNKPYQIAGGFAWFGTTSVQRRLASIANNSCSTTRSTSWTILILRRQVWKEGWFAWSLAVARMVIWLTQFRGLYEVAKSSDYWLVSYLHQLRVKIRCERKSLGCHKHLMKGRWKEDVWSLERQFSWYERFFPFLMTNYSRGSSSEPPTSVSRLSFLLLELTVYSCHDPAI